MGRMLKALSLALFTVWLVQAQDVLMQSVRSQYQAVSKGLLETAQAMPPDGYQFRFAPNQRSFGDWVAYSIIRMQGACAALEGVRIPPGPPSAVGSQPKTALVKTLQVVAQSCEAAIKSISDKEALSENVVSVVLNLLTDMSSGNGNMVGYLRAKGIATESMNNELGK